jgi:2-(1,2-epoxy-1,2-dihydrophenyl)acetyl-CoA isomerase
MSSNSFQHLIYTVADGVATITLHRPEVFNAFNEALSFEVHNALKQATRDSSVRVLVLTGSGKAFCSGQDLKASSGIPNRSLSDSIHRRYNPMIKLIRTMPKPVICKLNGVAAGAGCSLALACDLVIAAEEANLIEIFINIGLVPDSGSSFFLPRSIPYQKAFEWCTMAPKISAKEAHAMGLVNKVVPLAELDQAVEVYTRHFATAPTKAIGLIKQMLNKSYTASMDEMLDYEAHCQEIAGRSYDHKEGVTAFGDKRKPVFEGR